MTDVSDPYKGRRGTTERLKDGEYSMHPRAVKAREWRSKNNTAIMKFGKHGVSLTPKQVQMLRGHIGRIVTENLRRVEKVLAGELVWDKVQASLFTTLLNKTTPNLSENFHLHLGTANSDNINLRTATREELEAALLRSIEEDNGGRVIEGEAQAVEVGEAQAPIQEVVPGDAAGEEAADVPGEAERT